MKITLQNVTKKFPSRNKKVREDVIAVNNFDFEIPDVKSFMIYYSKNEDKLTEIIK